MPTVTVDDVKMYYERRGSGAPVLFISGTGWSGEHWNQFQTPFFSTQFETIVFDHRGCGRSDKPPGPYSTRLFAEDAARMLAAIGITEPVHVVGHSMGGRVAQWLALDYPEVVRTVVLAASGSGQIDERPATRGIPPEQVVEFMHMGWPGYNEAHLRARAMFARPEVEMVERFVASHRGEFGTDVLSYLRHMVARYQHHTTDRLEEITQPCLVIVGTEDTHVTATMPTHIEASEHLARNLPNAEYRVVEGAAHALHIEAADEFNMIVADYLTRR